LKNQSYAVLTLPFLALNPVCRSPTGEGLISSTAQ